MKRKKKERHFIREEGYTNIYKLKKDIEILLKKQGKIKLINMNMFISFFFNDQYIIDDIEYKKNIKIVKIIDFII